MTIDLILGTAGHIDHGKTSLIRALTGVDTDRLPEEKRRGITIELGFAHLDLDGFRLGIVDVPGHEKFVRTMLAGATGIDLALLVVAADDSVKQQTREHLDILRLLDLPAGVIAVTKCDLVDEDWLELVEDEIRQLVEPTRLANAPIVRTSATTGAGLDQLKTELARAAQQAATARPRNVAKAPFRMAIDRVFTLAGHGTVVTGSVSSGAANVGDELQLQPAGITVRVRSLQNHDLSVSRVERGQRAAINVAGAHHDQIHRGQELAASGHLVPSRRLTVAIQMVQQIPWPLKDRARVRLHVGTAEVLATVRLLQTNALTAGQQGLAQLLLREPAVSTWNQPFVLRSESPVMTIGGGQVLDPEAQLLRRVDEQTVAMLEQLKSTVPLQRAAAATFLAGLRSWKAEDLARLAAIDDGPAVCRQLVEEGTVLEIPVSPTRKLLIHRNVLRRVGQRMVAALKRLHDQHPLRSLLPREMLENWFRYLPEKMVLETALKMLQDEGTIRIAQRGIALSGHGPQLSQGEQKLLEQIIQQYRQAGLESPTVKQLQQSTTRNQASVPQLVALAVADGELIEVGQDFYVHADVERDIRRRLADKLTGSAGMTMSEIREHLETSRKYAVPICEYLDRVGFTRRQGDLRVLAQAKPT